MTTNANHPRNSSAEFPPRRAAVDLEEISVDFPDEWLPSHLRDLGAPSAWQAGYRGGDVGVAIVDSGIDMLEGTARRHLNYLPTGSADEILVFNEGWEPDKERYLRERVFLGGTFTASSVRREFIDEFGHGTKMAMIVGARPGCDRVAGLAPRVRMFNYKVANRRGDVRDGALPEAAARLLEQRESERIRVVLFALDERVWRHQGDVAKPLKALDQAGVVIVIAASDTTAPTFRGGKNLDLEQSHPCFRVCRDLQTVLVVGAHQRRGDGEVKLTVRSNYGPETVHLAARGQAVASASPTAPVPADGTSAAAALVAGTAALLAGHESVDWADPRATATRVRNRLLDLCDRVGTLEGKVGQGRILSLRGLAAGTLKPGAG